jgi:hypothetical protein
MDFAPPFTFVPGTESTYTLVRKNEASSDGVLSPPGDAWKFLHELIVMRRGNTDIALRPRQGHPMPTLPELTWPVPALLANKLDF